MITRWISVLALLLLPCAAWGEGYIIGWPAGGSCATALVTENGTSAGSLTNLSARTFMATKIAGVNGTVCKLTLYLQRTGSPSMNIRACLYSATASPDEPNAALACADYIAASTVGTSESAVDFTIAATAISSGTNYYVVLQSSAAGDSSNNIAWHYELTGTTERILGDTDGLTTWSLINTASTMKHIVTGQ